MIITWLGHSCFLVETKRGSVVLDPYQNGSVPGLADVAVEANAVLCSHDHYDHNAADTVKLTGNKPTFAVTEFATFHDNENGKKRGATIVRIINDGEAKIAHLGDLGCALTASQTEKLANLDVLMIPVGGFYTIDGVQAASIVEQLQPKTVIPMHYRSDELGFGFKEISEVDEFIAQFRLGDSEDDDQSEIDTAELPAHVIDPRIIVLRPKLLKA